MMNRLFNYLPFGRQTFNWHRLSRVLVLVLFVNTLTSQVLLPVLGDLTAKAIQLTDMPYITFTNLLDLWRYPVLLVWLVAAFILFAGLVAFSVVFLLQGILTLETGRPLRLGTLLQVTSRSIAKQGPAALVLILLLTLITMPFKLLGFNNVLLSRIKIPAFILQDLLARMPWLYVLLGLIVLGLFYLLIRTIHVIPNRVLVGQSLKAAWRHSFELTKDKFVLYSLRLVVPFLIASLVKILAIELAWRLQSSLDGQLTHQVTVVIGLVLVTCLDVLVYVIDAWNVIVVFGLMLRPYMEKAAVTSAPRSSSKWWQKSLVVLFLLGIMLADTVNNLVYFLIKDDKGVTVIAHRGVNEASDVQNTIPALDSTAKSAKPDYVELDVRWTSDHQWVVMHDGNTKALTGKSYDVAKTPLKSLTQLTVKHDGYEAPVASFDDYLASAQKQHQKLLVEIKYDGNIDPTPQVEDFLKRYQKDMIADGDIMHSLNLAVVEILKAKAPEIKVGLILPFNLVGNPKTKADFFTIEYSTLDTQFVLDARDQGKEVYAWTVNDSKAAVQAYSQYVTGIIGDRSSLVKETIYDFTQGTTADKVLNYLLQPRGGSYE